MISTNLKQKGKERLISKIYIAKRYSLKTVRDVRLSPLFSNFFSCDKEQNSFLNSKCKQLNYLTRLGDTSQKFNDVRVWL